ncbi:class I SAM-dependent methyltransferase [bacterium]|nr:class I SAM-dependent methyltransferase [bacterium]
MSIFARVKAKKDCWNIIKKYYPVYEGRNIPYKKFLEQYLSSSSILLDAGCGRGKATPINYKERVKLAIGVDLSTEIKKNQTIHKKMVSNVYEIPLIDNSIDIVVCQELIEHLEYPYKFFKEVSRILKRGGIFIMMTPNLIGWRSLTSKFTPYWFHTLMNKQLYQIEQDDIFPTYYRANTFLKLRKLLKNSELRIVENFFFEGSPKTLTFSAITTYLEIIYTKLIRRYNFLKYLRETIILVATKTKQV